MQRPWAITKQQSRMPIFQSKDEKSYLRVKEHSLTKISKQKIEQLHLFKKQCLPGKELCP